ncbi:MAG: ABC transporter ATP-binding protein [Intestinibacter sp.]
MINHLKNTKETILEVKNITKIYSKNGDEFKALDDISFSVKKGEFFGIVGESGSGKSTLAKQITRLEKPTEGQIILKNKDIINLKGRELRKIYEDIQMVFQDPVGCFDPRMKIGKSIEELLKNNKIPKEDRKIKIKELLSLVGLEEKCADKYPSELSGGQCQRAAIAKALSVDPAILVCDEITSALDVSIQGQIISLLNELKEKKDITYLFICHDLALVELLCDRIIVLNKGSIVEAGLAKEVIDNPMHPYTKLLVDSIFPIGDIDWRIPDISIEEEIISSVGCKFYSRCKLKGDKCLKSSPKLRKINDNHFVACYN